MNIDSRSWHCRLYLWWYRNKYGYPNENRQSNLCPYMRAVVLWAPMRALFWTWIRVGGVPINAVVIPVLLYSVPVIAGYFSYGVKLGMWRTYAVMAIFAALVALLFLLVVAVSSDGWDITRPVRKAVLGAGFWSLARAYLRSAHDRVCPEVSWKS